MANISSILKSNECNEIIDYMKYLFGEDYVDLLINYYNSNILKSRKNLNIKEDEAKTL